MARYWEISQKTASEEELKPLKQDMEKKQSRLYAARIAYLNRTQLDGSLLEYEGLKQIASEYIQASYAYQKALYGKVQLKLSIAKLLR
jgi:hypothetical protein